MINFLIENIFIEVGGRIFQQTVGIPMGTNCAPLLADVFLYWYEAECVQKKKLAQSFNYTFRYIDDVLSLNKKKFLHLIHPVELAWQPNFMINVTILTFLSSIIPFSTVTSYQLLHMVFTCRKWFDIREPVILIRNFYIDLSC